MNGLLEGKVALVLGGNRGPGAEIVKAFLREGASLVAIVYQKDRSHMCLATGDLNRIAKNNPGLDQNYFALESDIYSKSNMLFGALDAELKGERTHLIKTGKWNGGDEPLKIDILVNSAGIEKLTNPLPKDADLAMAMGHFPAYAPISADEFVDVVSPFIQRVAVRMRDNGSIINLTNSLRHNDQAICQIIEKMTVQFAKELKPRGISVNAISPGEIDTTIGTPEEVARVAVMLASPERERSTGKIIGGMACATPV